jgi:oligopeptide transport system ATP-binding protein
MTALPQSPEASHPPTARRPILEAAGVSKRFVKRLDLAGKLAQRLGSAIREETVHAVDGVDLTVGAGEVVGLVGESGCGKSTFGRMVAGILPPTEGTLAFDGKPVWRDGRVGAKETALAIQMIFQDPFASLDPRMRVEQIIGEAPRVHGMVARGDVADYVAETMLRVGLDPDFRRRYPHQFSGGQRQRIGIARALALQPEVIVCDEPVSALDVSVQAQVVNLLEDLQDDFGMSYLFIAHDLSVVRHLSDRIAVMYLGSVVEEGTEEQVYGSPSHPYTQALLSSVPLHEPALRGQKDRILLQGDVPSPADPPSGCRFRTRCWKAQDICAAERPALIDRGQGHPAACHFAEAREVVPTEAV